MSPGHPARTGDAAEPDETMSVHTAAALLDSQRSRAVRALEPDARLLYAVWGTAWMIAYGVTWLDAAARDVVTVPGPLMAALWPVTMGAAFVVTITHTTRRVRGVRGDSDRAGTMYGLSWGVAGAGVVVVLIGMGRTDIPEPALELLLTVLPPLAIGLLFVASAGAFLDWVGFGMGVWIVVAAGVAVLSGPSWAALVMAVLGGGGFLVGAVVAGAVRRSCTTTGSPVSTSASP